MQRPHLARRCPGRGWPLPVTLKPQAGHSRLQPKVSRSLRTIRCGPPPFVQGGFAGGSGTVALSRAVISSLVSLSLGLDRPSREVLLAMFLLVSVSSGLVRVVSVTSIFKVPLSGRSARSFRRHPEAARSSRGSEGVGNPFAGGHWNVEADGRG